MDTIRRLSDDHAVRSGAVHDERRVADALGLLDQAISILDEAALPIAAAKVDEARWAVHHATGRVTCLYPR